MDTNSKTVSRKVDEVLGSGTADKVVGSVKSGLGTAKATVGKWVGNEELRADGHREHAEGEVQHATGEAKGFVAKAVDAVEDAADTLREKAEDVREQAGVIFDQAKAKARELADEAKTRL